MISNSVGKRKSQSIEIYKKMLISRNVEEQMNAVNSICQILKHYENDYQTYTKLIDWLLCNDICVFLCEATATLQIHLLGLILECFKKFANVASFYLKHHSSQVVTSMIRTIQFLVKENGSESIIRELICFISRVLSTSKQYYSSPVISCESAYNAIQIFELLSIILDKITYETKTKISTAYLLHKVFEKIPRNTKITIKALVFVKEVIERCLKSLIQILHVNKYKCSKERNLDSVFEFICKICTDSLYVSNNSVIVMGKFNKNEIVNQEERVKFAIVQIINDILHETTSQMKDFELNVLEPNYDIFLELLNEFFNQEILPHEKILVFVRHLCYNGFLAFLAQLAPISMLLLLLLIIGLHPIYSMRTKKICLLNLAEMIHILSVDAFNIDEAPGGKECLRRTLFEGFMDIGINSKLWPQKLNDTCASKASINALIIYIYFNCLFSQHPENIAQPLLPYLVEFIIQLPKRGTCPNSILKCLWLIFSISSLSNSDYSSINGGVLYYQRSISIMSNLLLFRIKDVYTHNPFIIQWTFSSHRISSVIQSQALSLWLEKECVISQDLAKRPSVWSSLLEMIILGEGKTDINTIKEILKECLQEYSDENDAIRHELWYTLPDMLKSLAICQATNVTISVRSILCIMELCYTCPPKLPNVSSIQAASSLLPGLLVASKKYNIDVGSHFINVAYSILINALKHEDKYVLTQYINGRIVLQYIYDATLSDDAHLSKRAYELLTTIMYYKSNYEIRSQNCIKMDPAHLIKTLRDEKDSDKCISLLTLIYQTFKLGKKDTNTFVVLTTLPPIDDFVAIHTAIFFRLHMMCCKDLKQKALTSWYAMNSLLEFAICRHEISQLIVVSLASFPWTHKLIHFYLYQNPALKCHKKFLRFVYNWLRCQSVICGSDNIKLKLDLEESGLQSYAECDIMCTTLTRIIKHFNSDDLQNSLPDERKHMVNAILNFISQNFI